MNPVVMTGRKSAPLDASSQAELLHLKQLADRLRKAHEAGKTPPQSLRGKHLVTLCNDPNCTWNSAFKTAAQTLGAEVSQINLDHFLAAPDQDIDSLAALLGRLYDGIACHGMPLNHLERLKHLSGKPVFAYEPCSSVAKPSESDHFVDQALLLTALS